jgi:hypothetical protein
VITEREHGLKQVLAQPLGVTTVTNIVHVARLRAWLAHWANPYLNEAVDNVLAASVGGKPRPDDAFAEVARALKPTGVVILATITSCPTPDLPSQTPSHLIRCLRPVFCPCLARPA